MYKIIDLNEEHVNVLIKALDLYSDIKSGKWSHILHYLPLDKNIENYNDDKFNKDITYITQVLSDYVKEVDYKSEIIFLEESVKKEKQLNNLNIDEMYILINALELYSRIGIGQWREVLNYLPIDGFFTKSFDYTKYHSDVDYIGQVLSDYMIDNINGWTSSLGITSIETNIKTKIAWEMYQVIRKRVSWDKAIEEGIIESLDSPRKWPEMLTVNYDDPLKITNVSLIKVEKEDE